MFEHKFVPLEWKADGDQGEIEGYGSVYDIVDQGGDIVAPGAFDRALKSGRKPRMLFQHDPGRVIGVWDALEDDAKGLRVKGRVLLDVVAGREAFSLVKAGALDGLSIGYRVVKAMDRNGKRVIMQADLWEVSLVTFPMNEMSRIDGVKAAAMSEREMERVLMQDAGLTRTIARRLMSGGFDAIKAMQDAGDAIADLAQFMREHEPSKGKHHG